MACPACGASIPGASRYCAVCGTTQSRARTGGGETEYRIQPSELVSQLAVISTLMPLVGRHGADALRWGMAAALGVVVLLTIAGFVPAAVAGGSLLFPAAFVVYMSRTLFWATPRSRWMGLLGVVVLPILVAGVVALIIGESDLGRSALGVLFGTPAEPTLSPRGVAAIGAIAILLGVGCTVGANLGAILLARLPEFDDMLDGLALGVSAGLVYAAAETIFALRDAFGAIGFQVSDPMAWVPVVLNVAVAKPIVYALAGGLTVSAFSGLGRGYDGLTPAYLRAVIGSVVLLTLFWAGNLVLTVWPAGPMLAALWAALVAALMILRTRGTIQAAVLEKSIVAPAGPAGESGLTHSASLCDDCEMPLLAGAGFCAFCGVSQRATPSGWALRHEAAVESRYVGARRPWATGRAATVALMLLCTVAPAAVGLLVVAALPPGPETSMAPVPETRFLPLAAEPPLVGETDVPRQGYDISLGGGYGGDLGGDGRLGVEVPAGWVQFAGDGRRWLLTDGEGLWMYVETVATDASLVESGDLLLGAFDGRFGTPAGTQALLASSPLELQPFGSLAGRSMMSISGIHADPLFGAAFRSNLYAGLRRDGVGLIVEIRDYSGQAWDSRVGDWYGPMYEPVWRAFAGSTSSADGS